VWVRSYAISPQNGFEGLVQVEGISYLISRKDWACGTQMRGIIKLETVVHCEGYHRLIYTINRIQSSLLLQIGLITVRSNEFEKYSSFINEESINEVEIKKSK
jgi:hypothetical protein